MNKSMREFLRSSLFEIALSIPKTIYINFKLLPIKYAVKIPIVISHNIKLQNINKKTVQIPLEPISFACMRIGFGGSDVGYGESKKGLWKVSGNGKIIFGGGCGLSQGCKLIANNAKIYLGRNFRCNFSTTIDCTNEDIVIGDDVVCGWKVTIRNGDGHLVIVEGKENKTSGLINIGSHVWVCSNATVLKGGDIGKGSIVAYGALITSNMSKEYCLYGGIPAKTIRENTSWRE